MDEQLENDGFRPTVGLIVEMTDGSGRPISLERFDVVRPTGPVRQHEQLVQAVTQRLSDARISSAADGRVTFLCRGYLVTSEYEQALEREPA
ncbi:MAG: hypothetical protein WDZ37_05300 [Solirubrobacterales bacterium]